jgi:hypothetical protein
MVCSIVWMDAKSNSVLVFTDRMMHCIHCTSLSQRQNDNISPPTYLYVGLCRIVQRLLILFVCHVDGDGGIFHMKNLLLLFLIDVGTLYLLTC